jgi:hypothetical protein
MIDKKLRNQKILLSLILATIFTVLLSMRHAGIFAKIVLFVWWFWIPYSIFVMVKKPELRVLQSWRLVIWISAVLIVAGVHWVRYETARSYANAVAVKISSFAATHKSYPVKLEEAGVDRSEFHDKLKIAYYRRDEAGKPSFMYAVTYEPFSMYAYDFNTGSWEYVPD